MRVRYIGSADGFPDNLGDLEWVSPGKTYVILGVFGHEQSIKYRIVGDNSGGPALHDAKLFDLQDKKIPSGWVFTPFSSGDWELGPIEFAGDGFWEKYFDGDLLTEEIFENIKNLLEANS